MLVVTLLYLVTEKLPLLKNIYAMLLNQKRFSSSFKCYLYQWKLLRNILFILLLYIIFYQIFWTQIPVLNILFFFLLLHLGNHLCKPAFSLDFGM